MNKKLIMFFLTCVILGIQGLSAQENFSWQLALVKNNQGLSYDKTVSLKNGEIFNIQLISEKDCYVYIVVEQASGSMLTLMNQYVKAWDVATKGLSFTAGTSGQEKIHVVTSSVEQKDLQKAIDDYNKDKSPRNTLILQMALSEFKEDKSGELKPFGGSARGNDEPVIQGTTYSGKSSYKKTLVISH